MVTVTSAADWWDNLSPETQDRLAADFLAPVPEDLRAEVLAASTGTAAYPPFFLPPPSQRQPWWHLPRAPLRWTGLTDDYVLRGTLVAYIHADNQALLDKMQNLNLPISPNPPLDELQERARRRNLIA